MKKVTLKSLNINEGSILSKNERRGIVGGAVISGLRYSGGVCYCDYGYGDDALCDEPCSPYHCAVAFPDKHIPW